MQEQNKISNKTYSKSKVVNLEKGKIPPQAVDLEEAILGAMMIDKGGLIDVLDLLHKKVFYDIRHELIFEAIKKVYLDEKMVDLLTVSNQLKSSGNLEKAGGDFHLINLTQKVASSAHIEYHARIILQKFIQRELIKISSEIIENSYSEDADALFLIEQAYSKINKVSEITVRPQEEMLGKVFKEVIEDGIKIHNNEITPGIITPINKITDSTGGWMDGELIILAARPGMGKTSFALSCGLEPAKQGIPVAFFSLEMSKKSLASRLGSMEYKIDSDKFKRTGLDSEALQKINNSIDSIPFYIDDTQNITIEKFQIQANKLKSQYDIQLIVVDYIQLMTSSTSSKGNREQEVSKISRGLKKVALELDIPVIALSQLSRAVETRGGSKRPQLSDLRESGAIEQDADVVSFIYRPEYYGQTEWDDNNHTPCEGQAEFIVAKNRNGNLLKTRMKFEGKYTLFSDLQETSEFMPETSFIPKGDPQEVFEEDIKANTYDPDDLPF